MTIELEKAALEACGYRVHVKERNGTRWLMACKGLQVQYVHWHPLTNINQAMQLLIDAKLTVTVLSAGAFTHVGDGHINVEMDFCARSLIAAQCRAIVTACAGLNSCKGN